MLEMNENPSQGLRGKHVFTQCGKSINSKKNSAPILSALATCVAQVFAGQPDCPWFGDSGVNAVFEAALTGAFAAAKTCLSMALVGWCFCLSIIRAFANDPGLSGSIVCSSG